VLCIGSKQFWTTQAQFWQWVRDGIVVKLHDDPLTGHFASDHRDTSVLIGHTILDLAYPNHLQEVMEARRLKFLRK
jgi:hypothetical protein